MKIQRNNHSKTNRPLSIWFWFKPLVRFCSFCGNYQIAINGKASTQATSTSTSTARQFTGTIPPTNIALKPWGAALLVSTCKMPKTLKRSQSDRHQFEKWAKNNRNNKKQTLPNNGRPKNEPEARKCFMCGLRHGNTHQ